MAIAYATTTPKNGRHNRLTPAHLVPMRKPYQRGRIMESAGWRFSVYVT